MKTIFTLFCVLILFEGFSNPYEVYYRKWYFGNSAGIDFYNVSLPAAITTSALTTYDYGSGICDLSGNTLFYTNGETIWNKNNVVMTNGTNLNGSVTGGETVMILRVHSEENLYYVFTVSEFASANGFRYSIVDMSLQGGLGEVILKNELLFAPATEKLSAVYNDSDNSYWIIAHQWGNNTFAAYKLNSTGLDTIPILSSTGHINQGGVYGGSHDALGEMSVSPDGTRIACAYNYSHNFELYDFDYLTGVVSNPILISNLPNIWGVEFSSDSKKLYTTLWTQSEVAQYDISSNNSTTIAASKFVVGNVPFSGSYASGYLELAPNGIIYIAKWNGTSLSEIDNPDSLGAACGFTNAGFNLGGNISQCGLSPSPVFPPPIVQSVDNSKFTFLSHSVFPNPADEEFIIKIPLEIVQHNCNFQLFTIEGKKIISMPLVGIETRIKRENIPAGNYLCLLLCDGKIVGEEKLLLK
jgi:hypothetical protein